jgi:tRNA dimethylallyltransferase
MQVYRGMDIGTAKATPAERAEIPHHLLDLVEPSDDFTVAEFRDVHGGVLVDLRARGRHALAVGGTGLYHRVVVDDVALPGEWPEVRTQLEDEPDTAVLFARLTELDPAAAAKIEPGNRRRIVRALEVTTGSGRPFSSFGPGLDVYPPSPVVQIGIRWPRAVLAERIERRVHAMVRAGLTAEVAGIVERGGFSRTARQALGYKETLEVLAGRMSQDEATDTIIRRTRQFAVRQERWFRRDPRVRWIDVEHDPVAEVTPAVVAALTT